MTSHFTSSSLRFRNTDIAPLCYAINQAPAHRPTKLSSVFSNGKAVLIATFADGRGPCQQPVQAYFELPIVGGVGVPTDVDAKNTQGEVVRFEENIFGTDIEIITPTLLTPEMLRGLVVAIDEHVDVEPNRQDVSVLGAVVDSEEFRSAVFAVGVELSDFKRNGHHVSRSIHSRGIDTQSVPVAGIETRVSITSPSRFALARV